jgi:hypothetical protein
MNARKQINETFKRRTELYLSGFLRVLFQYNGRENGKVIELPKKLHVRVVSFQTYCDINYGVLHVQTKVKFVRQENYMRRSIFSFNCVHEGMYSPPKHIVTWIMECKGKSSLCIRQNMRRSIFSLKFTCEGAPCGRYTWWVCRKSSLYPQTISKV